MNRGGTGTQLNQYTQTANPAEYFCYDADGNLIADGKPTSDCNTANGAWAYTWDGENRLIRVEPAGTPASGDKKLEFQYDYRSRRVRKTSYTHNGSAWIEDADLLFVYDDWNVVLVLDANDSNAVDRKSTWGLDLSGLTGRDGTNGIHSAGGISGLLAIEDVAAGGGSSNSYWYFYDANGNVGQLIKASDQSLAAHYEYDPYGNAIAASGPYSAANPWRFSTKWHDTELPGNVLIYYGYRYYNPRLGRWMNWDPIGEQGFLNVLLITATRESKILEILRSSEEARLFMLTNKQYWKLLLKRLQGDLWGIRYDSSRTTFDPLYVFACNSPLVCHDADGNIAQWVASCGVGCLLGGIGGFLGGIGGGWQSAGCGALGGAISGCCSGVICTTFPTACTAGSCVCAALGNMATQMCMGGFDYEDPCAWISLGFSTVMGCLGGAAQEGDAYLQLIAFVTGVDIGAITGICGAF